MRLCNHCGVLLKSHQTKYCSNRCQSDHGYILYISNWKNGSVSGARGSVTFNLSAHVVRYITSKYNNKCGRCGWNAVNQFTKKVPLEIDHIDGNSANNIEDNLILLCPNCHSLTKTYKNANIGHGRLWRRKKYVKIG